MISESKYAKFGQKGLIPKGITVHNTNNQLSAMDNLMAMEYGRFDGGCHFFVDENGVLEAMPLNWCTWHTGKGYDMGNMNTIAIEICRSQCSEELYSKAEARAVALIKLLMEAYNLTEKDIYFHNDFNPRTYCPHRILQTYKSKSNWIQGVFK